MTNSQVLTKAQLLKNICNSINELSNHGISAACIGVNPNDGSQIVFGTPPTETFFLQRTDVLQDHLMFCKERSMNSGINSQCAEEEKGAKNLRKMAADHLNTLYKKATGKSKFPYKKVSMGEIIIDGLPDEVQPIKFPSHYGENKLKAILSCQRITVLEQQEYAGVSKEPEINEDLLTEENVQVLLPLFEKIQTKGKKRKSSQQSPVDLKEYNVEKILSQKKIKGKIHYLVKWVGFPEDQNTWEPKKNIPKPVLDFFLKAV